MKIMQFGQRHLISILQDVGSYMGRAYENPTPLAARKLCSLLISMLKSILEDVGTYMVRAYENPNMRIPIWHVHEHITTCWFIYGAGYENPTPLGARKLCSLVISMLMSILQDVGTYIGRAYENPIPQPPENYAVCS
jgi:hypothetical protein